MRLLTFASSPIFLEAIVLLTEVTLLMQGEERSIFRWCLSISPKGLIRGGPP